MPRQSFRVMKLAAATIVASFDGMGLLSAPPGYQKPASLDIATGVSCVRVQSAGVLHGGYDLDRCNVCWSPSQWRLRYLGGQSAKHCRRAWSVFHQPAIRHLGRFSPIKPTGSVSTSQFLAGRLFSGNFIERLRTAYRHDLGRTAKSNPVKQIYSGVSEEGRSLS